MSIKITTRQSISVSDWDKLVEETYGKPYSFQQQEDCRERGSYSITVPTEEPEDFGNDGIPEEINGEEMCVKFDVWLARNPKEWNGNPEDKYHLRFFWYRNFYPDTEVLAYDLYKKGLIPAGEYDIIVDW